MIRLFWPLYLLLIIAAIIFVFSINNVAEYILEDMLDDVREQQLGGIVLQLDEQVNGLSVELCCYRQGLIGSRIVSIWAKSGLVSG